MSKIPGLEGSIDILFLFAAVRRNWYRKCGLFIAFAIELFLLFVFYYRFDIGGVSWLIIIVSIFFGTWVIWLLSTKRLLFRNSWLVLLWTGMAISSGLISWYFLYPNHVQTSVFDLPYIRIWGSVSVSIIVASIGLLIDKYLIKGKRLFIVFAVDNNSLKADSRIYSSINLARKNIIKDDADIRLEVLPLGIISDIKKCEKYIKRPFTRADAVVFASVIDDQDEYAFVDFTSRINERRFSREERGNKIPQQSLSSYLRSKDWNFINAANDNCSRTIVISRNLEEMLRMYIGCVYIMKHKYKESLPYTDSILPKGSLNNQTDVFAARLFAYSYLSSAKVLETEHDDIEGALSQLQHCMQRLPATGNEPGFNKAMARLMFYLNDIKASKMYTKSFKEVRGHEWGYELNMGFYAMVEGKVVEFVRHYRHLTEKYAPLQMDEINFAIDFLYKQKKTTKIDRYRVLLSIAIAYLFMYKSIGRAKRQMNRIRLNGFDDKETKELNKLRYKIEQRKEALEINPSNNRRRIKTGSLKLYS